MQCYQIVWPKLGNIILQLFCSRLQIASAFMMPATLPRLAFHWVLEQTCSLKRSHKNITFPACPTCFLTCDWSISCCWKFSLRVATWLCSSKDRKTIWREIGAQEISNNPWYSNIRDHVLPFTVQMRKAKPRSTLEGYHQSFLIEVEVQLLNPIQVLNNPLTAQ